MKAEELREHIDKRLDKIEEKLDSHLDRLSAAETSIEWIRGHLTISVTILLAVAGFFAAAYFNKL